ncbi:MAG: hypothetical protein AAF985_25895 [Bacteroidota bacterium]
MIRQFIAFIGLITLMVGAQQTGYAQENLEQSWQENTARPPTSVQKKSDVLEKITYANGDVYEGQLANGNREGQGKMTYANDNVLEAEWKDDKVKEEGSLIFANGNEYFGQLNNDLPEGTGSMIYKDGHTYSGDWKQGEWHGRGALIRTDKSQFHGNFEQGERAGEGKVIWGSGDTLSGFWIEDQLEGKSLFQFTNGDQLLCHWSEGNLHVRGTYSFTNGREIKGSLKQLREEVYQELDMMDATANFQRAWLGFALEFKSNGEFDLATDFLLSAQQVADIEPAFSASITAELGHIKSVHGTATARLPLSTDRNH